MVTRAARDRRRIVLAAGVLALLAVAVRTGLRILANLPFDPVVAASPVRAGVAALLPATLTFALVALALATDRETARVGLLFAGVFGFLGTVSPSATLPAVVAILGGGALALLGTLGRPSRVSYTTVRERVVAGAFVAAIAISLGSAVGLVSGGLRGVGAMVALAALVAVGTQAEADPVAFGAGALGVASVVVLGTTSPYVVGSALLVGFAVTGVPYLLVALAVGGAIAAAVAGFRRGEPSLAIGVLLLVFAGVPVTLPRAMALLLGAVLVVLDTAALAPDSPDATEVTA